MSGIRASAPVRAWLLAAAFSVLMIAASVLDRRFYPDQAVNPASLLGVVACMAGHGLFIAADLSRRKKPVQRWWLLGAVCLPVGLWIYLIAEYRLHAFWQIPFSVIYYLVVLGWVPAVIGGG